MLWLRAFLIWWLLVATEVVHGTLRTLLLTPALGDLRARQLSVFTGSFLILAIACLTIRWLGARSRPALLAVGLLWLALMLTFEIVLGRVLLGYPWARIPADYDLGHGGLLPLGMLILTLSPLIAARLRGIIPPVRG